MKLRFLSSLRRCTRGAIAIETAIVAPILLTLSVGAFEASSIVARQHELQSAASEGEAIALTFASGASSDVNKVKDILQASLDLGEDQITVAKVFRCGISDELVDDSSTCGEDDIVSTYLRFQMNDNYTPLWTGFGIGKPIDFSVTRTVQVS